MARPQHFEVSPKIRSVANVDADDVEVPTYQEFMKIQHESERSYIQKRRSTGLTEDQKNHFNDSIQKIKTIVQIFQNKLKSHVKKVAIQICRQK